MLSRTERRGQDSILDSFFKRDPGESLSAYTTLGKYRVCYQTVNEMPYNIIKP